MGTLALLVTAILATLVLYFWARKAQLEKQLAQQREENQRILSIAEDLRARLRTLRGKQREGSGIGLDVLDRLFEQYYVFEGTENLEPRILKEVSSLVEGLRHNSKLRQDLERSLDEGGDNVVKRFRTAFPLLKEEDYQLFLYVAAGFSLTTVSALLGKDKPYVYNRLYRLRERVKSSNHADAELFLSYLDR